MPETFNRYAGEVRSRFIVELRRLFSENPKYRGLEEYISRAMPTATTTGGKPIYPSESIVVSNISSNHRRLAPDNFVGNLHSFLAKIDHPTKKGLFLDWIKEDTFNIQRKNLEDVSQTRAGNKLVSSKKPIVWEKNTEPTKNPNHVEVYLDGNRIYPVKIEPKKGEIIFDFTLPEGEYIIKHFYRNLEPVGLYQISITKDFKEEDDNLSPDEIEDFEFYIDTIVKRDEILTDNLTASGQTFQLSCPALEVSFGEGIHGYALNLFSNRSRRLAPGEDYTYDPANHSVTILSSLYLDTEITAAYRSEGDSKGPFKQRRNSYNNQALQGVILAFGPQIEVGDKAYVEISDKRVFSSLVYGGLWEISLDFSVYAKDPNTEIELTKYLHQYLEMDLRPLLSFEGIEIESINFGGESTEVHLDSTGDPYFTSSISVSCNSFWERRYGVTGYFTEIFPEMFYILSPSGEYYFVNNPGGAGEIVFDPGLNAFPKDYPSFSGRSVAPERQFQTKNPNDPFKPKSLKNKNKPNDFKNKGIVGFF